MGGGGMLPAFLVRKSHLTTTFVLQTGGVAARFLERMFSNFDHTFLCCKRGLGKENQHVHAKTQEQKNFIVTVH